MNKKQLAIATLFATALLSVLFAPVAHQQGDGTYDPWLDYNEDGQIDVSDLHPLGQAYGTSGDPTRIMYMKYSTYWWTGTGYIDPLDMWSFENTTQGYGQMSFIVVTNSTVDVVVDHLYHLADEWDVQPEIDRFTVYGWGYWNLDPYNISRSPSIEINIENPSSTVVAEVILGIYMTA